MGFCYSTNAVHDGTDPRLTLTNGDDGVTVDRVYPGWDARLSGSATLNILDRQGYLIVAADSE